MSPENVLCILSTSFRVCSHYEPTLCQPCISDYSHSVLGYGYAAAAPWYTPEYLLADIKTYTALVLTASTLYCSSVLN